MANYLDETGLARVWGKVKGLFTKSNVETALGYTINKSVPSDAAFTDANVTQTATDGSSNAEYEILFSGTADNTTRTEGAKKTSRFTFNPQTNQVTAGHFTAESTSPSGTSTATLQGNDVKLGGTSNTWDGTNTSLKTTISGIKQSLSDNKIGARVDISSYTTTSNLYVCPCDGFAVVDLTAATNAKCIVRIFGSDSVSNQISIGGWGNGTYGCYSCFVRKGMRLMTAVVENNGKPFFIPLTR